MIQRLKKMKENKKGFTLVELIVVLVILAILIALLVPSLTGYIDKARQKSVAAEARMVLEAIQTEESDEYGTKATYKVKTGVTELTEQMKKLAEVKGTYTVSYTTDKDTAKVTELIYTKNKHTAKWDGTNWTIDDEKVETGGETGTE